VDILLNAAGGNMKEATTSEDIKLNGPDYHFLH
ncbi:unnamed protein product, partial [marine sediment metagenome]